MAVNPTVPPDDPGDHGKGGAAGSGCCDDTNTLLETISDTLIESNSESESCCSDTQDILTDILAALGASSVPVVAAFTHGQNTDIDSGAAEQVVAASNPAAQGVLVKAMPNNTGTIYIGIVGVTTVTGFPLEAGESITLPVDNANKVYAIADIDNQAVAWVAT